MKASSVETFGRGGFKGESHLCAYLAIESAICSSWVQAFSMEHCVNELLDRVGRVLGQTRLPQRRQAEAVLRAQRFEETGRSLL
jgi:hypothetical protein